MEIPYTSVEDPTVRKVIQKNPFWEDIMKVNDELDKKKKSEKPAEKPAKK